MGPVSSARPEFHFTDFILLDIIDNRFSRFILRHVLWRCAGKVRVCLLQCLCLFLDGLWLVFLGVFYVGSFSV